MCSDATIKKNDELDDDLYLISNKVKIFYKLAHDIVNRVYVFRIEVF